MKNYLIISSLSLLTLASCTKDISRFNEETKKPSSVPAEMLFSNGVRNLVDGLNSPNVNTNVLRFTVQHWAATTYQDEPNYDFTTRNIPQSWWTRMYRDVLADLNEARITVEAVKVMDEATRKNQLAIIDIMQVYTYNVLVNSFGNIPYTEALDYDNLFPKYDDAKTVYADLMSRLNADINAMDASAPSFSNTADFFFRGNVASWIKFANTLKLRMAMTVADDDVNAAKAAFEQASPAAINSSADDVIFRYEETTPNTNPIWLDIVQSGRADFVAGKPLLDQLVGMSDPRLEPYFAPNAENKYIGGTVGSNNTYSLTARPSDLFKAPELPGVVIDYVEAEFLRAEAIERGFSVEGTAAEHYANAVKASIIYWGGSAAEADAYLAKPEVNYATAAGDWKQKIGFQKWIALYNRPFDGWTELRRLDQPKLGEPAAPKSGFPNRFTYPNNEQQLNGDNYTKAASDIGGDKVETKIFWDKF